MAYECLEVKEVLNPTVKFKKIIWFPQCPLKQRLFFWLTLQNKILTEDNLRKKRFMGPSRCVLCKIEMKIVNHLFIFCSFSRYLWSQLLSHLNLQGSWTRNSLEEAVEAWIKNYGSLFLTIPVRVWWGTWIHRNKVVFEDA